MNPCIKHLFHLIILFIFIPLSLQAQEQEAKFSWPLEIDMQKGVVTLYQPQPESFHSDILEARMALSFKPQDDDILFGALWLKARISVDMDARTVTLEKLDIPRVHFPGFEDQEKITDIKALLIQEMESWDVDMSLDRLMASLNEVEDLKELSMQLNNDPPAIYFRTSPAILITIDGDPVLKKDDNSKLEYVVNTPFFIVKDQQTGHYYIKGGSFWYKSGEMKKGWEETDIVPPTIKKFAEASTEETESDSTSIPSTEAPELIVVTKPSELIITDGKPDYASTEGTTLLYVKNSDSDILMDINTQDHYVLLAGRWYHSRSLKDGDWKFAEPDDLPEDFAKIPEKSDMASVRTSVPGTLEAQDALLEQSIPQTAAIDRKTATVEVTYDGNPEFQKTENTEVSHAVNTDMTVLLIKNRYYCVDDGIWFESSNTYGPWEVSVKRPEEVDDIPPSSVVYNVKYVYIYDSTPEVVYVGYLPGYTYSYVYGGTVVYGTGYYYSPWYRTYYYPRPVTWGYGVHYSPWIGWGFYSGIGYGWIGWRIHPYRGWWGPRGYNRGYRRGYNRGYRRGARAGYRAGRRSANRNVYRNRSSGVRHTGDRRQARAGNTINSKARPSSKPNNMYTDKSGNVHQRKQNGNWEQKSNVRTSKKSSQKPDQKPQTRPSTNQRQQQKQKPASTSSKQYKSQRNQNTQQMERSHQNRNHGNQRYNQSRTQGSRGGGSRSGGGRRSGGGGRR
ncbi:MAG: hypothetical protein JRJ00_08410 [Deltaproteobacteria bacterium]|nr:hypothetical protein [Deltaproteobacteria bacterium]